MAEKPKRRAVRYGIRVIFANGGVGFLRHGEVLGSGPIMRFASKRAAEDYLDFIRQGLDEGETASIFRIIPRGEAHSGPALGDGGAE